MAYRHGPQLLRPDMLSRKVEQLGFHLLNFGHWKQDETPDLRNDILSNYKLVCMTKGSCVVSIGHEEYIMGAGDCIMIAPFVLYTAVCTSEEAVEFFDFHFNIKNIEHLGEFQDLFHIHLSALYPSAMPPEAIPMLHLSFENMVLAGSGHYYFAKLTFLRTMLNLLVTSPDYISRDTLPRHTLGKERTVEECVKYLKVHEDTQVSVADLCRAVHVSQSYLYQSFLSITGQSTKEFIITYKLKLLELELKHSNRPIQSLADCFGFSSVYALSSQFKKYYGVSPLQYRKRYLAEL